MKLNLKFTSGMSLLALLSVILMITSPIAAVPAANPQLGTNTYDLGPNIEFGNVVAGIGQSVYASAYAFGGNDGSAIPLDTSATAFSTAQTWLVISINQSTYGNYLQQAPSPIGAPDGLSLHLVYPVGMSDANAVNNAFAAAAQVTAEYGVNFGVVNFDLAINQFSFWANNSNTATVATAVADDVVGMATGLPSLLDTATVTNAPVYWSAYGARTFAGSNVVQYGAGWVDTDGLTDEGAGIYSLNSANIFGGQVSATTQNPALSRVTFTVPYPIEPTSISPATSNPLPHVTGIAQWDLVHPAWGNIASTEFEMQFALKTDEGFPNIQNKFTIDQAKLNNEGILEGTMEITNLSPDEDAHNVEVVLPLGEGFKDFAENNDRSYYRIDSDNYSLDTSFNVQFEIAVTGTPTIGDPIVLPAEEFLDFSGWYRYVTPNTSVADWDMSTNSTSLPTIAVSGGVIDITINSNNGFPTFLLDLVENEVLSAMAGATVLDTEERIKSALRTIANETKNNVLNKYYIEEPLFTVNSGDFDLSTFEYGGANPDAPSSTFSFFNATIPTLSAGQSTTLQFSIDNIPVVQDLFQFFKFSATPATGETGDLLPNATIVSFQEDWYSVMQYMFQLNGIDGRPLSFGYDASISFGIDDLISDSFHSENYMSHGAWVRFENAQGFPFYSLSNAQNVQIADDEAVVSGVLELDKQVYHPGENKTISVELFNSGDISAENVKVHLYHATLGRGWAFERAEKIQTIDVGTLAAGQNLTISHVAEANSFVGYSPVYAYIEFDSDVGNGSAQVRDYFNTDENSDFIEFEAAAEAHHLTFSTLTGALLLPNPGEVDLNPTIPEPRIEISKDISDVDANGQFSVTYDISNTGEADTTLYFVQSYATAELTLVDSSDDPNAIKISNVYEDYGFGYVGYSQIQLDSGESTSVTLEFELVGDSAILWPAGAYFTLAGESTLGGSVNTGAESSVEAGASLQLSAGSEAQEDSQKSANEDGSSSSYSASSSVGASVNTNIDTGRVNTADGIGFIGYDALGFLALMAVPLTLATFLKRKR